MGSASVAMLTGQQMSVRQLRRYGRAINTAVWVVAVGVMVYGAVNVYQLLRAHEVPAQVAWLLSPLVDVALCAALVGDRVLHTHGERAGWGTMLRWSSALMTWGLNIALPLQDGDVVGVLIHSVGPALLCLLAEASASYQLAFARLGQSTTVSGPADPTTAPTGPQDRVVAAPDPVFADRTAGPDRRSGRPHTSAVRSAQTGHATQSTTRSRGPDRVDVSDLLPLGVQIAAELAEAGRALSRAALIAAVRERGRTVSTDRANALLAALRSGDLTGPDHEPDRTGPLLHVAADRTDRTDTESTVEVTR